MYNIQMYMYVIAIIILKMRRDASEGACWEQVNIDLTHWPWETWPLSWISNLQTNIMDKYLEYFP